MPDIAKIATENDLKTFLYKNYMIQIQNFFGDQKKAMKFLSSVMSAVQKTPELLKCDSGSLINSFMTMAQLALMPSDVSGEAYVLPYKDKAQFQLGCQGLITLFYRAGGERIRTEIVRKNDVFSYENGIIKHSIDIFKSNEERGEAVGAYAIADVNGKEIAKAMNKADIINFGVKFSKSYKSEYSPWKEKNDPELWMWKKTVLKQLGKLLPKNETINRAIAEDNQDSIIADRLAPALESTESLKMGAIKKDEPEKKIEQKTETAEEQKPGKICLTCLNEHGGSADKCSDCLKKEQK